jgi:DNA-binding MarR family transcriptional regulator
MFPVYNGAVHTSSAPDDPERDLQAVMRASQVIAGIVAESIAQTGHLVTLPQLRTMVLVSTRPAVNARDIAAVLDIHPSNATRLVDRLVQAGLLERREADDRRHLALSLTENGAKLVESVLAHRRAAYLRILQTMPAPERRRLSRALQAFADAGGEPTDHELLPL